MQKQSSNIKNHSRQSSQSSIDKTVSSLSSLQIDSQRLPADPFASIQEITPNTSKNIEWDPKIEAKEPLPESLFSMESVPMKPELTQPLPKSDLLSGWDEFEALFASPDDNPASSNDIEMKIPEDIDVSGTREAEAEKNQNSSRPIVFVDPPTKAKRPYESAVKAFKAGKWNKAMTGFSKSFNTTMLLSGENVEDFRRQCANEYAASLLLHKAQSTTAINAAHLARYAAFLTLSPSMLAVCKMKATALNMDVGNYGWAGDALSTLMISLNEGEASMDDVNAKELTEQLNQCDTMGPQNASIPIDEDMASFGMIVSVSQEIQEIDEIVSNLHASL